MLLLQDIINITRNISFNKSCLDCQWEWDIKPLYSLFYSHEPNTEPETVLEGYKVAPSFQRPCTIDGTIRRGWGGAVFIPKDADETRAFFKCWQAISATIDHELMEAVNYKGKRVLNPHKTLEELQYFEECENGFKNIPIDQNIEIEYKLTSDSLAFKQDNKIKYVWKTKFQNCKVLLQDILKEFTI